MKLLMRINPIKKDGFIDFYFNQNLIYFQNLHNPFWL